MKQAFVIGIDMIVCLVPRLRPKLCVWCMSVKHQEATYDKVLLTHAAPSLSRVDIQLGCPAGVCSCSRLPRLADSSPLRPWCLLDIGV